MSDFDKDMVLQDIGFRRYLSAQHHLMGLCCRHSADFFSCKASPWSYRSYTRRRSRRATVAIHSTELQDLILLKRDRKDSVALEAVPQSRTEIQGPKCHVVPKVSRQGPQLGQGLHWKHSVWIGSPDTACGGNHTPLLDLPTEILLQILAYASKGDGDQLSMASRIALSASCRRLRNLIATLFPPRPAQTVNEKPGADCRGEERSSITYRAQSHNRNSEVRFSAGQSRPSRSLLSLPEEVLSTIVENLLACKGEDASVFALGKTCRRLRTTVKALQTLSTRGKIPPLMNLEAQEQALDSLSLTRSETRRAYRAAKAIADQDLANVALRNMQTLIGSPYRNTANIPDNLEGCLAHLQRSAVCSQYQSLVHSRFIKLRFYQWHDRRPVTEHGELLPMHVASKDTTQGNGRSRDVQRPERQRAQRDMPSSYRSFYVAGQRLEEIVASTSFGILLIAGSGLETWLQRSMTRRCFAAFCYFLNQCFPRIAASSKKISPVAAQLADASFSPEQDTTNIQREFLSLITELAVGDRSKKPNSRSQIVDKISPVVAQLADATFSPEQDTTNIQRDFSSLITDLAGGDGSKQPNYRSAIVDNEHALVSLVEMGVINAPNTAHREFAYSCFELLSKLESGLLESLPSGALRTYHEIARRRVRKDVVVSDALLLSADEVRPGISADTCHEDIIVMPQFECSRWQCTIVLKDLHLIVHIDPCGTALERDTTKQSMQLESMRNSYRDYAVKHIGWEALRQSSPWLLNTFVVCLKIAGEVVRGKSRQGKPGSPLSQVFRDISDISWQEQPHLLSNLIQSHNIRLKGPQEKWCVQEPTLGT